MPRAVNKSTEMPGEIVRVWEEAGATYGIIQVDESMELDQSRIAPIPQRGAPGLRGFSFARVSSRLKPGQLANLPIPPIPFGLVIKSTSENNMDDECDLDAGAISRPRWFQELGRFSGTLVELELWGSSLKEEDLLDLQSLSNLRTLGICGTSLWNGITIKHLKKLPALETLRLPQSKLLVAEGNSLAALPKLKNLFLHCFGVTAAGIARLGTSQSLCTLQLEINLRRVDRGVVEQLARLPFLKHLSWYNSPLEDRDLAALANSRCLEGLVIFNDPVTDTGAKSLSKCKSLVRLNLAGTPIGDGALAALSKLPNLQRLDVSRTAVGDVGVRAISRSARLRHLNLLTTEVTDDGLRELRRCKTLQSLYLDGESVSDAGLQELGTLRQLTHLIMAAPQVTDDGLKHLKSFKKLRSLDLRETSVTDDGLKQLAGLPELEVLDVDVTILTDVGLKNYLRAVRPATLHLEYTAVTDSGLKHLAKCTALVDLSLESCDVTDAGLKHLEKLKSLQSLNLCHTSLTDRAINSLLQLKSLRFLDLSNLIRGADEMTVSGIKRLAEIPTLRRLALCSWPISDEEVQELRGLFGDCQIWTGR